MGVYANTVSMMQYRVEEKQPSVPGKNKDYFSEKLATRAFKSIDTTNEETSMGWVQVDNMDQVEFDNISTFVRDNYIVFSLRRDQRKIPASAIKSIVAKEEAKFLIQHPNLRRTPKNKREEIKEAVRSALLGRCIPSTAVVDVVWDTEKKIVTLFSLSNKVVEHFEDTFRKTFEEFSLSFIPPFTRACELLKNEPDCLTELMKMHGGSESVASLVSENKWLGQDFQLWLLYRGLNNGSEYRVGEGDEQHGQVFQAWVDEKLQMIGGGSEGALQKVAVSGIQDSYVEAKAALRNGKSISSSIINLEKDENCWKLTLQGDTFGFASYKTPAIHIEKDATVDELSEREAVFFEKMHVLERGCVYFNSLLLEFLKERLSHKWAARMVEINEWLNEG